MGKTGTEVTKEASDMVITDDNFASIAAAVEEGRGVYDNIKKTLQYLLAGNLGELLVMTVSVMAGLPIPLLPIHILWINLVTDGLPALALATDPIDPDVMKRSPRRRDETFTDRSFLATMILTGILTAGMSLAGYLYGLQYESPEIARTHAFAALVYTQLLCSFGFRSETKPFWEMSTTQLPGLTNEATKNSVKARDNNKLTTNKQKSNTEWQAVVSTSPTALNRRASQEPYSTLVFAHFFGDFSQEGPGTTGARHCLFRCVGRWLPMLQAGCRCISPAGTGQLTELSSEWRRPDLLKTHLQPADGPVMPD